MLRIQITPSLSELSARYSRAAEYIPQLIGYALAQAGDEAKTALHDGAPYGTGRTGGHLADSFFSRTASEMVVNVGTNQMLKLTWVTMGTATPILPLVKLFLWSSELPHPMAWVHGQQANDFVAPVLQAAPDMLAAQVPEMLRYLEILLAGA